MTITRAEMMPMLVAACPSFGEEWDRYVRSEDYEPELHYLQLAELARHLIELDRRGVTDELSSVFEIVERLHTDGDEWVREAATIGLLEALQNNAEHRGVDPNRFVRYLLPETRSWWDELNRFWSGESAYVGEKREKP